MKISAIQTGFALYKEADKGDAQLPQGVAGRGTLGLQVAQMCIRDRHRGPR